MINEAMATEDNKLPNNHAVNLLPIRNGIGSHG